MEKKTQWQLMLLSVVLLISIIISGKFFSNTKSSSEATPETLSQTVPIVSSTITISKLPQRNWNVLDPDIQAQAVFIKSLDDDFSFVRHNIVTKWPIASLTKLVTAVTVLEDFKDTEKITVDQTAVATEGTSGNLKSGEVYTVEDMLKIMLLVSSNDAAQAIQNNLGEDRFVLALNNKAEKIGMKNFLVYDASGLNDMNESTAEDIMKLLEYISLNHTEILNWTRLSTALFQPLNDAKSNPLTNINPFVEHQDFLGGKTGTSNVARENFAGIFSFHNTRVAVVILGSPDRIKEKQMLFDWIEKAYTFQQ